MAGAMAWVICGTTGELQETPGLLCHRFLQLLDVCGWVLTILDGGTNSLVDDVSEGDVRFESGSKHYKNVCYAPIGCLH
jgi:hypothetical protein